MWLRRTFVGHYRSVAPDRLNRFRSPAASRRADPVPDRFPAGDAVFEYGYTTTDARAGFGLSIVRRLLESHGWTIELDHAHDGARFVVSGVQFVDPTRSDGGQVTEQPEFDC
ncbi:hypothetical protein [Natrinema caseinilyticum]|uniref:hypothetical protein n=1 Tax=Natrinema caseinilyticum TaxID=2961570 RepID=UPI0020C2FC4C|nr:hypothetical protein [Natrinema caseinilyticum]